MAKKRLSDEDLALWQRVTAQAEPLARTKKPVARARKAAQITLPRPTAESRSPALIAPAPPKPLITVSAAVLPTQSPDRRTATKLKRGQIAIEAKLDLHGMTQGEAHEELRRFIAGSREAGRRCVLVVTGVGARGGGVLRRSVPRWLAEPSLREAVLNVASAEQRHGGQGALYVLLRKKR